MKRSERHRLKENDLSHALAGASQGLRQHGRTMAAVVGVVILVLVSLGGFWAWRARAESRAQALLGEAIVIAQAPVAEGKPGAPATANTYPTIRARAEAALAKYTEAYTAHPSTDAGIAARYYAAATLATLGRPVEAVPNYQEVINRAGRDSFFGRLAQLGAIEANAQAKQFDAAISAAQAMVDNTADDTIPRDALLMELGRIQAAAGKTAEAKQTLDRVIAEFPDSPYVDEAKRMLSELT